MASILVVEDEARLADSLQRGLRAEHHVVEVASDGVAGLAMARAEDRDLLVLDWMLPGLSGLELCRRLRAGGATLPILMLTARDTAEDIVAGLDAGADDYLVKPFAFDVLLARVRTLLRRSAGFASPRLEVGPVALDPSAHRVWVRGEEVSLTAKEHQLLDVLIRRRGAVLSRERLRQILWEREDEPDSNALEVHVAGLRRKIGCQPGARLIHTVRGVGYVLRLEEP